MCRSFALQVEKDSTGSLLFQDTRILRTGRSVGLPDEVHMVALVPLNVVGPAAQGGRYAELAQEWGMAGGSSSDRSPGGGITYEVWAKRLWARAGKV
jgi:hypothetical protein